MAPKSREPIPGQLAFESEIVTGEPRFNPEQLRAFGSVPGLIGKNLDIPEFHRLDALALRRVEPKALEQGLFGVSGRNAVDGLALNPEEFTVIVRNAESFQDAIRAKTVSANQLTGNIRGQEKEFRSVQSALRQKAIKHEGVLKGLANENERLSKLANWQHTPGYWKTSEADLRILASDAWNGSFGNILRVLKDQHQLTTEEHHALTNAMAYRLFRGPQRERVGYWGNALKVGLHYNRARTLLFEHRKRVIEQAGERIDLGLGDLYNDNDISPLRT
jgi:hypothetical protein